MNFPILSNRSVKRKVADTISKYDKFLKKTAAKTDESLTFI